MYSITIMQKQLYSPVLIVLISPILKVSQNYAEGPVKLDISCENTSNMVEAAWVRTNGMTAVTREQF